jgi:hypothetical protein
VGSYRAPMWTLGSFATSTRAGDVLWVAPGDLDRTGGKVLPDELQADVRWKALSADWGGRTAGDRVRRYDRARASA